MALNVHAGSGSHWLMIAVSSMASSLVRRSRGCTLSSSALITRSTISMFRFTTVFSYTLQMLSSTNWTNMGFMFRFSLSRCFWVSTRLVLGSR